MRQNQFKNVYAQDLILMAKMRQYGLLDWDILPLTKLDLVPLQSIERCRTDLTIEAHSHTWGAKARALVPALQRALRLLYSDYKRLRVAERDYGTTLEIGSASVQIHSLHLSCRGFGPGKFTQQYEIFLPSISVRGPNLIWIVRKSQTYSEYDQIQAKIKQEMIALYGKRWDL